MFEYKKYERFIIHSYNVYNIFYLNKYNKVYVDMDGTGIGHRLMACRG